MKNSLQWFERLRFFLWKFETRTPRPSIEDCTPISRESSRRKWQREVLLKFSF